MGTRHDQQQQRLTSKLKPVGSEMRTSPTPNESTKIDKSASEFLGKTEQKCSEILGKIMAIFPAMLSTARDSEQQVGLKRELFRSLVDAGINSDEQLNHGYDQCRTLAKTDRFGPTMAEFAEMCKTSVQINPKSLGLPPVETAFLNAIQQCSKPATVLHNGVTRENRRWIHPVVYETAREVGFRNMISDNAQTEYKKVFKIIYLKNAQALSEGKKFQIPPVNLLGHNESRGSIDSTEHKSFQAAFDKIFGDLNG